MQGYIKKKHRTHLDLLSTNTEYTESLGYHSVFRVCYITSIDRCRHDPGYVQYHRNNYMFREKIRVHLDLMSIPRLWRKKCQNVILSTVVHIKTHLDLLGIQTLRWDQRLQLLHWF